LLSFLDLLLISSNHPEKQNHDSQDGHKQSQISRESQDSLLIGQEYGLGRENAEAVIKIQGVSTGILRGEREKQIENP
jgi:hypothetical protein